MIFRARLLAPGTTWDPASLPLSADPPSRANLLARHRTGWTARLEILPFGPCVLKLYVHPGLETLRGAFRNTFLAPSRAAREARTLLWLRDHGLGAPEPLGFGEERFLGWLKKAWILTRYVEAEDVETLFSREAPPGPGLFAALGDWLGRAHGLGLEDRNPHLRNFLARPAGEGGWEILKVDSPRARIHKGPAPSRARGRDLAVLAREARRLEIPREARRAFLRAYREAWGETSKRKVTGPSFTR